jgi:hypothetical protein
MLIQSSLLERVRVAQQ